MSLFERGNDSFVGNDFTLWPTLTMPFARYHVSRVKSKLRMPCLPWMTAEAV